MTQQGTRRIGRTLSRRGVLASVAGVGAGGAASAAARAGPPAVRTALGPVRGRWEDGVAVFRGIRYGADTGPRRFQAPRAPDAWSEVLDSLSFGPASPQNTAEPNPSEDCLVLNVWTPAPDRGLRPVLVYIHGGAYASGSGSAALYDGGALCRRGDVVVVTVNHRLNAFGYLYLDRFGPGFDDSGNAGQLDLVLALRWVRDNVAAFGGDPANVTLFGQSGGGAKIATLMATPAAAGLFHRAATMSGQQVTACGPLNATDRARVVLDALKLRPAEVDRLRTIPAEALLQAIRTVDPVLGYGGINFAPVLDDRTLHRHPFYPDAPPQSAGVPMMIGGVRDETRAFMGGDETNFTLGWDALPGRLTREALRVDVRPETVIAEYRRLYPDYTPSDVLFAATTAARSWRGGVIEAEARAAQGAPAWVYQLDWPSPRQGGRLRAHHTLDIPLMFGTLEAAGDQTGTGAGARLVSSRMQDALLAFARNGDPNHPGLPRWEPYRLDRRQTMIFDVDSRLEDDPRGAERRFFARIPYVQPGS